ncbi:MAG TPA: sodium/glutamate symporter [Longimicrobium sp.]|nr:sodium/glutamate symporter [Longimicrobium sp.]
MLKLDLIQTVAFAGLALFLGHGVRRLVPPLARNNVPAPVVGGLLVAVSVLVARSASAQLFAFDTTLQAPLMIAFFTSIGFGASVSLLKKGGPQVLLCLGLATLVAVMQNVLGMLLAVPLGVHPLTGVLAGSVTLAGGPATGLAFAPDFEAVGVPAASAIAVASAMVGIVTAGLVGGPIATWLVERNRLRAARPGEPAAAPPTAADAGDGEGREPERLPVRARTEGNQAHVLLKTVVVILATMWAGAWVSQGITSLGVKLPAYIGAMLVAAVVRNVDERTGWIGLSHRTIGDLGGVALALFITMALMTLKLWEIAGLAVPLLVILAAQVAMVALICLGVFRLMGKDYEAAVITGGFCGFMLGITANAVANMEAMVERYGPAPRAFLVVPMVGAFFIDFTNSVVILTFLNFWR